jgi:hypothetical protein
MTAYARIEAATTRKPGLARVAALGVLFAVLLARAVQFTAKGVAAVRFPWELDYGEGIVWQQARLIFSDKAYGPIDHFGAIVFHYTPIYHAVTALVSGALGTDELATGRAISLLATFASAIAAGVIAVTIGRENGKMRRWVIGSVAGLSALTFVPVAVWALLMRVDMLALALSLAGVVAALKAAERPRWILLASVCFVAAVYTKQIAVAAPIAVFSVLLATRPKLALQGIGICVALGSAALGVLTWLTDGGFFRHVFLYNVNRLDGGRLWWLVLAGAQHAIYCALGGWAAFWQASQLRSRYRSITSLRAASAADIGRLIGLAYLGVTTAMLLTVTKSGSSINYFVEWCFALSIFVAVGLGELTSSASKFADRKAIAVALPLGLALQAAITPPSPWDTNRNGRRAHELAILSKQVAAAKKPVISDDMVLLLRSGRQVLWEPAIFAELASTGVWDQRPFVQRVRNGEFAFFVTSNKRGEPRFDQRYNPAVADAMDEAYPVKESLAGLLIHRPRSPKQ